MGDHEHSLRPESWLVSAGRDRRPGAPLNVLPVPASNFVLGDGRAYARDDGTPTWEALEEIVGGLEGGHAVAFASGMAAAVAAIFDRLPSGSVVALPDDCYQGVAGLAEAGRAKGRWTVERVAVDDFFLVLKGRLTISSCRRARCAASGSSSGPSTHVTRSGSPR